MTSQVDKGFNPKSRLDFLKIAAAARAYALPILQKILPGGRLLGDEYVVRNPGRADRKSGSFKINIKSGCWADFATDARGGDIISLVAYLEGVNQGKAARLLASMLGMGGDHG